MTWQGPIRSHQASFTGLGIVILAVVLAYANGLKGTFVFDDHTSILAAPQMAAPPTSCLRSTRPLLLLSFWINDADGALSPLPLHMGNLAIHLAAVITFFFILLRHPWLSSRFGTRTPWVATLTAGIWGLHPLCTQAVTYISQRAESMAAMFLLLGLLGFQEYRLRGQTSTRWLGLSFSALVAAGLTKENMIIGPIVVAAYDLATRQSFNSPWDAASRRRWYWALCLAALLPLALMQWVARDAGDGSSYIWQGTSAWHYLLTQTEVICYYLRLAVWPADLCFDYLWPVATNLHDVLPATVTLGGLLLATTIVAWKRSPMAFPLATFWLLLAPTSSVFPRPDCAFEYRMYLPLAALLAAIVPTLAILLPGQRQARVLIATGLVIILALGVRTHFRNRDYASELALCRSTVAVNPSNLRAANDLAVVLCEAGLTDEALAQFDTVIARAPATLRERIQQPPPLPNESLLTDSAEYHLFRAESNLALLLHNLGRYDEAITHHVAALRVFPNHGGAQAKIQETLRAKGVPEADLLDSMISLIEGRDEP